MTIVDVFTEWHLAAQLLLVVLISLLCIFGYNLIILCFGPFRRHEPINNAEIQDAIGAAMHVCFHQFIFYIC